MLEEDDRHLNIQLESVEQHIVQHIRSCNDITLVTSLDRESRLKSVEDILKKYSKEIRSFFLTSEFFQNDKENDSASISDLADMADVILGSTHTEKYFVVILENAEDLQLSDIEELCEVIHSLNKENNHIGILLVCDPIFVNIVKDAKGIADLTVSECSLDKITQEDIQTYIDNRQQGIEPNERLHFDSSALKFIATHATGSLYEASILLEWSRLYANHKNTSQLNSELINLMFSELLSVSPQSGGNLLADYPPADFSFNSTTKKASSAEHKPFINPLNPTEAKLETAKEPSRSKQSIKHFEVVKEKPGQKDIPTLQAREQTANNKSEKIQTPQSEKVETDRTPQLLIDSHTNEKQTKKYFFTWVIVISVIVYGLYHFSPELIELKQKFLVGDQQITSSAPQENTTAEVFEEIVIPKEEIITPAQLQDEGTNEKAEAPANISSQYLTKESKNIIVDESPIEEPVEESLENISKEDYSETAIIEPTEVPPPDNDEILAQITPNDASTEDINKQTIDVLLEIADEQFNKKELTTPDISNAFNTYQLILQIDPNNPQASEGLVRIVNRYIEWINTDIRNNNIRRARVFLRRAFRVAPNDSELKRLLAIVEQKS